MFHETMHGRKYGFLREIIALFIIVFAFCMVVYYYKGIWPFGQETVIWADMTNGVPLIYYLQDVMRGADSFLFSWRWGTGIEMLGIVAQQSMLSPINLILRFFNREYIYGAIGILLAVKISLMSCTMYFYLLRYGVKKEFRFVGAIAYATGMSVLVQNPIVMTLDIGILLPVLIWAYEEGMGNKRKFWYPLLVAVCMALNLYMSVMVIFYIIISTGIKVFLTEDKSEKSNKVFYVLTASLEGVALSAIIWVPVLVNYIGSSRTGSMSIIDTYLSVIKIFNCQEQIGLLFLNLTAFIALILCRVKKNYFHNKEVLYVGGKFILLLLAVCIPSIELLWHMGSHSGWPWRFCFIFQFALIDFAIALQAEYEKNNLDKKFLNCSLLRLGLQVASSGAVLTGIGLFYAIYNRYTEFSVVHKGILYGGCVLVLVYVLIYWMLKRNFNFGRICFIVVFLFEITANCVTWLSPTWGERQDKVDMAYVFEATKIAEEIEKTDNKWIRTKDYQGRFASNYAAVMDVYSIANWVHLVKEEQQNSLEKMGYATNYTRFLDNGGTIFSDIILGYRNAFSETEINTTAWLKSESVNATNWYTLQYDVPEILGFDIASDGINDANVFMYQNNIFQTFTGLDESLFSELSLEESIFESGLDILFNESSELYIWTEGNGQFSIELDGDTVEISNLTDKENDLYPIAFNNGIIDLGLYEAGESCNIKLEKCEENVSVNEIHISMMDYKTLEKGLEILTSSNLRYQLNFKNTGVDISLENVVSDTLYLPVLYSEGWVCKINGVKTDTINYNGFLCIPVTSDNMNIKLRYYPPGLREGIIVFFVFQIVEVLLLLMHRKWKVKVEKGVEYLTMAGIGLFMLLLYIIPVICFVGYMVIRIVT